MIQNLGNRIDKMQETFNKDIEELKRNQATMKNTINGKDNLFYKQSLNIWDYMQNEPHPHITPYKKLTKNGSLTQMYFLKTSRGIHEKEKFVSLCLTTISCTWHQNET